MKQRIRVGLAAAILMAGLQTDAALLAYDGFATDTTADPSNGVYATGFDLGDAANKNVSGGTIVGFGGTDSWTSSAYYDAYAQKVRLVGRTYSSAAWADRGLDVSMAGRTEAYASLVLRVAGNAMSGGQVLAGFSDATLSSTKGAAVGYKWDGVNWDMVLRYSNAGGATVATIREDVAPDTYNTFYWSMNADTDTIRVWVNTNDYAVSADLTVEDWQGTVGDITHFSTYFYSTGADNDAYLDTIQLGDTAEAIGMFASPMPGFLFALAGSPDTDLYVAPSALGNGLGLDAANAAAYTNAAFWSRVQGVLASDPVMVNFLEGSYSAAFGLSAIGNATNPLTLSGESPAGVVFNGTASTLFDLIGCRNMVLENLNFTGSGAGIGYALRIKAGDAVSQDITVRNCRWHDMDNIIYGATGVSYGSRHVTYENCSFERIGLNSGSHMMYHAYNADDVSAVNCHFEDCAGSYVRFRAGSDHGMVSNCTFVSTQTYPNRSATWEIFVDLPVFNDVDPGDETFAQNVVVANNSFQFHSGAPANRVGVRYYHKGFDPTGWNYLMTASEGAVLEGSDAPAKKSLLNTNCGIDFDNIVIEGNTWQNETGRILFGSYAGYGAVGKGWEDMADVSDIVFP